MNNKKTVEETIIDLAKAAREKMDHDASMWYLMACTHDDSFEVELPLIKLFRWEFLKYKQYICPSCKTVGARPWEGYVLSKGSGMNIDT